MHCAKQQPSCFPRTVFRYRYILSVQTPGSFFNAAGAGAPEQFAALIKMEIARWARVITDANISVE